jgi:hypothetical protein
LPRAHDVDPERLDAAGDRMEHVTRGKVVEPVRAVQAEGQQHVDVRHEPVGVGRLRVEALVGLRHRHAQGAHPFGSERFRRPHVDDVRGALLERDLRRAPEPDDDVLGHGARHPALRRRGTARAVIVIRRLIYRTYMWSEAARYWSYTGDGPRVGPRSR